MGRRWINRLSPDASGGGWWLNFGADDTAEFNEIKEAVKTRIPDRSRHWDRSERAWWIATEEYVRRLSDLLPDIPFYLDAGADARRHQQEERQRERERERREQEERDRARASGSGVPPADVAQALALLCLTPSAPVGLVGAARRWWARESHPDHGGSHEAMVAINNAADKVEAWLAQHAGTGARP
jgi:hypothetical protein